MNREIFLVVRREADGAGRGEEDRLWVFDNWEAAELFRVRYLALCPDVGARRVEVRSLRLLSGAPRRVTRFFGTYAIGTSLLRGHTWPPVVTVVERDVWSDECEREWVTEPEWGCAVQVCGSESTGVYSWRAVGDHPEGVLEALMRVVPSPWYWPSTVGFIEKGGR